MPHKWRHWLTQGPQPPARARARARARTHRVHSDVGNVSLQMPHLRGIAQSATWCPNVASLAHVASESQVWPDMASKCGVTCPRRVSEPGGVAKLTSKCGVTCPRGVREPGGVAKLTSKCGVTCPPRDVRERWRGWTRRQNVALLV